MYTLSGGFSFNSHESLKSPLSSEHVTMRVRIAIFRIFKGFSSWKLISGVTAAESNELDANNAQIKPPPYRQFDHDPFRIQTVGSTHRSAKLLRDRT